MDTGYISALAALAGSAIGGLTSFATSWLNQHKQSQAEAMSRDRRRRQALYKAFIEEASRLYADALERQDPQISTLVGIYTMISRMRILSSSAVIEAADAVAKRVIELYLSPNRSFADLPELLLTSTLDPLNLFSQACREELQRSAVP
jgi:hypothetical protein